MKLPKFINKQKSQSAKITMSNSSKLNASALIAMTQNQLLLTDDICRFQPAKARKSCMDDKENKKIASPVSINKTPKSNFIETNSFLFAKQTSNTNVTPKIIQLKSTYELGKQVSGGPGSNRYTKSNQPKRLQRNRLQHVTSKPSNYELRSNVISSTAITTNAADQNLMNGQLKITKYSDFQQTPVRCLTLNNLQQTTSKCAIDQIDSTPKNNGATSEQQIKQSGAGFSLSKLSKFVSRSALKVMNGRKSLDAKKSGSNGSSPASSLNTSTSSSNTSMNADDNLNSNVNNDYNYIDEKEINAVIEDSKAYMQATANIYHSLEQEEMIKLKLNQQTTNKQMNKHSTNKKPIMGITSLMLNQYKRANCENYGHTTGMMQGAYFIGIPIVFKSSDLMSNDSANYSATSTSLSSNSTYDRLTRPMPQTSTIKPSIKPSTLDSLSTQCRISIYNSNQQQNLISNFQLDTKSAPLTQFDNGIIETVF